MVSRLDRLFILLDAGSNESIRLAAAKQIGEVQKNQPNDLSVLRRIKEFSTKNCWDTRVAAGHAIRCVLEQIEPWPGQLSGNRDRDFGSVSTEDIIKNFDLDVIISSCPCLLSTNSTDNDDTEPIKIKGRGSSSSKATKSKDQLMRQRQLINKELGISLADSFTSTDIVSNDDLQDECVIDGSFVSTSSTCLDQDIKTALIDFYNSTVERNTHPDNIKQSQWPLHDIVREYVDDLFSPSWEIRHGSAIALREVVRLHGRSAGRRCDISAEGELNHALNQLWLIDLALKTLCVLELDRFNDFLFDQVVSPVRENAAQILGCCAPLLSDANTLEILKKLRSMLSNQKWEVRHGGTLGFKYMLNAIDKRHLAKALDISFDALFKCLKDDNDDVAAEAAATLLPFSEILDSFIPDNISNLIKSLWEHISDLDELTSSTSNIVLLLASLITSSSAQLTPQELVFSMPKLWPLLSHSSTNVRISVLKALSTLIRSQQTCCLHWIPEELMSTFLRLIFQRAILESMDELRPSIQEIWSELLRIDHDAELAKTESFNLLKYTSQYLNYWLCLTMQPSNVPIDRGNQFWLNIKLDGSKSLIRPEGDVYIASSTFNVDTAEQQKTQVVRCRLLATELLGTLYARLVFKTDGLYQSEETLIYLCDMFTHYLKTKSASQRMISGWILESWARHRAEISGHELNTPVTISNLYQQIKVALLEKNLCYDELASNITRLQHEAREFVGHIVASNIVTNLPINKDRRVIYNLNQIQSMCDINIEEELTRVSSKKTNVKNRHDIKNSESFSLLTNKQLLLIKSNRAAKALQRTYSISTQNSLACALVAWNSIPDNLDLICDPILDSIETQTDDALLNKSVEYLIRLFDILSDSHDEHKSCSEKILNRLIDSIHQSSSTQAIDSVAPGECKIIQLDNMIKKAETSYRVGRRQSSTTQRASIKRSHSMASACSDIDNTILADETIAIENKYRGSTTALAAITKHLGATLPTRLPKIWTMVTKDLRSLINETTEQSNVGQILEIIKDIHVLEIIGEPLDISLRGELLSLCPDLVKLLATSNSYIRHYGARFIGTVSKLMFNDVEKIIIDLLIPMLKHDDNLYARGGAIEAVSMIIENMQLDLVPKIDMFIVQVLRRMSDQNEQVRLMANHCFGKLLSLMPLNQSKVETANECKEIKPEPSGDNDTIEVIDEAKFVEQLLNPKGLTHYKIPFETCEQLRAYQQEGLNWLAFLNRFNLHGILCDEMGLGKTFMTICMVASHHFLQERRAIEKPQPSLIVCPSTLIEHWLSEIEKFVPTKTRAILNPVGYNGSIGERSLLRHQMSEVFGQSNSASNNGKLSGNSAMNIIITSYEVLRIDIEFFKKINWNYCVLDEGHIIKNGKTKLSRAIRLISAAHRLILSGTPIQNNVTELWSLFDFLMPGYLGSERQFNLRFAKPILQSREPKCSPRELEAGALAMESLHRQVLPFILRRLKEDVLSDLPPKIIQDYYCDLTPLQLKLYEDFNRSKLCKDEVVKSIDMLTEASESTQDDSIQNCRRHIFQALHYLRNVCIHPKLVLTPKYSPPSEMMKLVSADSNSLNDIEHSPKLKALKQLLIDCGIGALEPANETCDMQQLVTQNQSIAQLEVEPVFRQHRALIFCQQVSVADIVENDLLKKHFASVTYLRLDGTVRVEDRMSIVKRFNEDPSIDILLLTTRVGGLGVSLVGADTVIFVEHHWNPFNDLQAMDRAHRIGQKKGRQRL